MRIYAALGSVALLAATATAESFSFSQPALDVWHYPFNFTPGIRTSASCFGANGLAGFEDRDGTMLLKFDTSATIAPGQGAENYCIDSITLTLTNLSGATWDIDLTTDDYAVIDVNLDVPDPDPGRPIELFGVGFGPSFTPDTYTENSTIIASRSMSNVERDPFPFTYADDGTILKVEDSVKGLHNSPTPMPFTPQPWAIGVPEASYTPGSQTTPFEVTFEVDLTLLDGHIRDYFQQGLNDGELWLHISSFAPIAEQGDPNTVPNFFTKESTDPDAQAPLLTVNLGLPGDLDDDCVVNNSDLGILLASYLACPGDDTYNAAANLTGDDCVNNNDLGVLLANYLRDAR